MPDTPKETFFGILNTRGEAQVRARLEAHDWGENERWVWEWLQIKADERLTERDKQAIKMLAIAERSAAASDLSAKSASDTARWTFWIAVISLITVGASVAKDWLTK